MPGPAWLQPSPGLPTAPVWVPHAPQGAAACDGGQRHGGWEPQTSKVPVPPGPSPVLACWGAVGQQPARLSTTLVPHRPRCLQPLRRLQPLGHHHGGTLHCLLQEPRLQRVAQFQRLPVRLRVGRVAAGSGRGGTPCPGHSGASSPLLTAHLPISAVLPRCHPAMSAAAMPTCSSMSWPARPPACSQPCFPGDPLRHPSEPAPLGFSHLPPRCKREVKRRAPEVAAAGGWRWPGADPGQGHPSSELKRAAHGRAGPRQLRRLLVTGIWFLPWGTF